MTTTTTYRDRVELDVNVGSATLTLAREKAGNSLDLDMARALLEGVSSVSEKVGAREVRCVILKARGPMFCVGGDLQHFADAPDRSVRMREVATAMAEALTALSRLPVPVISVVTGTAAGGGVGVALAADIVIVGPTTRFKMAYTAAGLSPDCGATLELVRRTGLARALDLVLTDRLIDGVEAERLGLATTVAEEPEATATGLAAQFVRGSFDAYANSKQLLRSHQAMTQDQDQRLAAEVEAIAELVSSPDGIEGVNAFLAKRSPEFR